MSIFLWLGIAWTALRAKRAHRFAVAVPITGKVVRMLTAPPDPVPVLLSAPRVCAARQTAETRVRAYIDKVDADGPVRRMLLAYGWDSAYA